MASLFSLDRSSQRPENVGNREGIIKGFFPGWEVFIG